MPWIFFAVACLLIGAASTVTTSWWIAARGNLHTYTGQYTRTASAADMPGPIRASWPRPDEVRVMPGTQRGYEMLGIDCTIPGNPGDREGGRLLTLWRLRFGWPMIAMEKLEAIGTGGSEPVKVAIDAFEKSFPNSGSVALPSSLSPYLTSSNSMMPARPVWPGFVINTLLCGLAAALLFHVPRMAMRRFWRKAGRCGRCGYDIGALAICPECGSSAQRPQVNAS